MGLESLMNNLEHIFRNDQYERAEKDAGELGAHIEIMVCDIMSLEKDDPNRDSYEEMAKNLVWEMEEGVKVDMYQQNTLTIYKCLMAYAGIKLD